MRGHPRSLEVVLPLLRTSAPARIIDALQNRVDRLGEVIEDASLAYAFSQMSPRTRRHLPFIGLFASYVHAGLLEIFVASGDKQQETYQDTVGEALDAEGWEAVLEEASRGAMLRPIGTGIYRLHPTLPPFFRRQLVAGVGEDSLRRLDAEFMSFYAAWAGSFFDDIRKGDTKAVVAVTVEEANLLRALRLAEIDEEWGIGQPIVKILYEFYRIQERTAEWSALRERLLDRVGRQMAAGADRSRGERWMYLLGTEASDALARNESSRTLKRRI